MTPTELTARRIVDEWCDTLSYHPAGADGEEGRYSFSADDLPKLTNAIAAAIRRQEQSNEG